MEEAVDIKEIEKLKEENRRLKKENKRLKIQNSFKDDLISAISHEFKNPISIINGYIETILYSNLDDKTKEKFLKKVLKNTNRLTELINRLYLITKLENQKITPKFTSFRLDIAAKELIEGMDERVKLTAKPVTVKADKHLIEIVLQNLISNALKYSKKEVIVNIADTVEIKDYGIGIDEEEITKIKEKFYRIAKNEWDNSLGLGLSIVENILKLHNTSLNIQSKKGKGSVFSFDITSLKDKESPQQLQSKPKAL
ncbi:MAG: sensor histidine kinase [Epsilonproteobacteria bacterium]|nr:sensor histidine kinase [Campylobacterota bacterium]